VVRSAHRIRTSYESNGATELTKPKHEIKLNFGNFITGDGRTSTHVSFLRTPRLLATIPLPDSIAMVNQKMFVKSITSFSQIIIFQCVELQRGPSKVRQSQKTKRFNN
jgi:hypothetical protein